MKLAFAALTSGLMPAGTGLMKRPLLLAGGFALGFSLVEPARAGLTNPGFEEPRGKEKNFAFFQTMPGWKTTDKEFEVWGSGFMGVAAHEGTQFVELNAWIDGTLYQDSKGIQAGSVLEFTFAHRGRAGDDTMKLTITDLGADNSLDGGDDKVLFTKQYTTGKEAWAVYDSTKEKPIEALGNTIRFAYGAISAAGGSIGAGNFLDAADFGIGVVSAKHEAAFGTKRLQTFGVSGKSSDSRYLGLKAGHVGIPDETDPKSGRIFVIQLEKAGAGAILKTNAGQYLTAQGKHVVLTDKPEPGSTWLVRDPLKQELRTQDGWFSLESAGDPGRFLRHFSEIAYAHKTGEMNSSEAFFFPADASWRFVDADPLPTVKAPSTEHVKAATKELVYEGRWDWDLGIPSGFTLQPGKAKVTYIYGNILSGDFDYAMKDNGSGKAVMDFDLADGNHVQFEWMDWDTVQGRFWHKGKKSEKPATQSTMRRPPFEKN